MMYDICAFAVKCRIILYTVPIDLKARTSYSCYVKYRWQKGSDGSFTSVLHNIRQIFDKPALMEGRKF